jgi:hypothetical protein
MKRLIRGVIILVIFGILVFCGWYKLRTNWWPFQNRIQTKIDEQQYEIHEKEDSIDFEHTALASPDEREEIKNTINLSQSFFSTHQGGSSGMLHIIINNNTDIVPLKANMAGYYLRLKEDKDLNCLTLGSYNKGPFGYEKYKQGEAKAYSGGIRGIKWMWGDTPLETDIIVNFHGKKVLVKDLPVNQDCGGLIE